MPRTPFADIGTRRHALTGTGWPEIIGTRVPVGERMDTESHAEGIDLSLHDYTYGLSRKSLRPVVLDEDYEEDAKMRAAGQAKRNPNKARRKRPAPAPVPEPMPVVEKIVARYSIAEPVLFPETRRRKRYVVAEPVVSPYDGMRSDFTVETMLADLLEGSQ